MSHEHLSTRYALTPHQDATGDLLLLLFQWAAEAVQSHPAVCRAIGVTRTCECAVGASDLGLILTCIHNKGNSASNSASG